MEAQHHIIGTGKPGRAGEAAMSETGKQAAMTGKAGQVLPFPSKEDAKRRKRA
jgi:hypothetical protein